MHACTNASMVANVPITANSSHQAIAPALWRLKHNT